MRPMTERELRRLKRVDLLELLIAETKENEQLRSELKKAREQLQNRQLTIEKAGSIAEASLRLSGIFTAAQQAADMYLLNIKNMAAQQGGGTSGEKNSSEAAGNRKTDSRAT